MVIVQGDGGEREVWKIGPGDKGEDDEKGLIIGNNLKVKPTRFDYGLDVDVGKGIKDNLTKFLDGIGFGSFSFGQRCLLRKQLVDS